MKRVLVALLAISMAAGVLTGCGSKGSDKTFTVGFDAEFPPYGYRDDSGEYVGFDLDLAAEVCKRQGWELVKQPIDWDAKDMELSSGAIDCIWNGFTMNGREDAYIVALEMEPERLKIGDFKYKTNAKQSKWGIRPKVQPKIAHLKNGKIVFDPLTKELLGTF